MNPLAIGILWSLSILMAGAIVIGPVAIAIAAALVVAYTIMMIIAP